MKKITYPITEENFSDAWNYTSKKLTEVKRKKIVRDFLKLFANIALLCSLTLLTYGVLMNFGSESIIKFLDSLTILKNMWSIVSPILYEPSLHIGLKFAIYLGILIVPTAIVSGLVTLIVWIVYNPNTKKEESGNKEADSLTLYEMSKELSARADSQKGIFSSILIVAYIFEILYIGVLFVLFLLKENNIILHEVMFEMVISFFGAYPMFTQLLLNALYMLGGILFFVIITLFAVSNLFLKPFYKTKVDAGLKSALENYYYICNPSMKEKKEQEEEILKASIKIERKYPNKKKELSEEELEIQKSANEIRERRTAERKTLSKTVNYEKPVYKILKIATSVLPLVLIIAIIINISNMSSVDLYNNFGVVYIKNDTSDAEYEVLKEIELSNSENVGFISSIEDFQKLTPEQRELLLKAWQVDRNNPEEVEAFLKESGLYEIMHQEDTSGIPTLEEAMEKQQEEIKKNEHLQDGIWGN